jgi:hypothetical protein
VALLSVAALGLTFTAAHAAQPFNQATVTKVENVVNYGEIKAGGKSKRRANVSDVVRASNFLLSENDSRAELQYEDGSVVRIGQNTVFSFDASSRSLSLEKGALIFYIPKGSGGGTVRTPSLTAAITGTVGKVSKDMIAILEGEVTLKPSGRVVPAGSFARRNPDGTITIAPFDLSAAMDGKLMTFNGPMPGFEEPLQQGRLPLPDFSPFESLQRTQNHPSGIQKFFPEPPPPPRVEEEKPPVFVPPPVVQPPPVVPPRTRPNPPPVTPILN